MANTPLTLSLSSIADQLLPAVFSKPATLVLSKNDLIVNDYIPGTGQFKELVLLNNWSVSELIAFISDSEITLKSLVAINNRVGITSYRFEVEPKDFESSKTSLAEYCLEIGKEAALLDDAPRLSTPGLLVMDMDSTTIEIECIDEIAKLAGVGDQVAEVTELAMQGKLDFAQSLKQRVATLKDSPESILNEVANSLPLMPGLESLLSELKQNDWKVAIASGGFTYFANQLKNNLGFDDAVANELEIVENVLTGKVKGGIVDAQVKADTLLNLKQKYDINENQTVAMGDGANDLVMMEAASLGVAYKAKPLVLKKADSSINFSGLDLFVHWLK